MSEDVRRNMGLRPCTLEGLSLIEAKETNPSEENWKVKNLSFQYKNSNVRALDIEEVIVNDTKVTAIIGGNGQNHIKGS